MAEAFQAFARAFSVPGWLVAWPCGVVALCRGRRGAAGHPSLRLFAALHLLAGVPAPAFLFLVVAGGSPTAQLSGSLGGWSAWVAVWPVGVGGALLAAAAFVPVAVAAWTACARRPAPGLRTPLAAVTLLTGLSLAASLGTLMVIAPTA